MATVDLERLRKRADRAFGNQPIDVAVASVRQIVGPVSFNDLGEENDLVQLAQEALRGLRADPPETPPPKQFAALQLLVQLTRPSLLSAGGSLQELPDYSHLDLASREARAQEWAAFKGNVGPYLYSVGRLDGTRGDRNSGTCFLVRADAVVTNRHVLGDVSNGAMVLERGQATVNFGQEWGLPDADDPVPVLSVLQVDPTVDLALLEIPTQAQRRPLKLAQSPLEEGQQVAVVGYPYEDGGASPKMMDMIFEGKYGVKRAAPGEVVAMTAEGFTHDASTLGGNSGSPVLSIDAAEVVGVHSSGFFMWRNEAIGKDRVSPFL